MAARRPYIEDVVCVACIDPTHKYTGSDDDIGHRGGCTKEVALCRIGLGDSTVIARGRLLRFVFDWFQQEP